MKTVILALGLMLTTASFAKEIMILDLSPFLFRDTLGHESSVDSRFEINRDMNRAWVEMVVVERVTYSQSPRHNFRSKVEGLSFDPNTSMVVLEHEGKRYECATVRKSRVFREDVIRNTGECWFTHRMEKVPYDDGYRTGTELKLRAYLNVE